MLDKYSVNVFWSEEDRCFVATCSEFPLLSAFGDTREEATAEFQIVLEMAIESYQENGLELPKPKTLVTHSGQFRLRLPKSLHKALADGAEHESVSLNTYIVSLLTETQTYKKVYTDKIEVLERLFHQLVCHTVSHREKLQVYKQRLDFLENNASPSRESKLDTWWAQPTIGNEQALSTAADKPYHFISYLT